MLPAHEPPAVTLSDGVHATPVDVERIDAHLHFDVANGQARGQARIQLQATVAGHPVLDLRQQPDMIRLDGQRLSAEAFPHRDLGGGPGSQMRVLDRPVEPGPHLLELEYPIDTPDSEGALAVDWVPDGVRFDLWMSDLHPGRYLEMWIPANLCHDRFELHLNVTIEGTARPHAVIANGAVRTLDEGRGFVIRYPSRYTSLSPMLVVAPADQLAHRRCAAVLPGRPDPLRVAVSSHTSVDVDLDAVAADVGSWLGYLAGRYGPWAHGDSFRAVVWEPGRGMEYDGATTAALGALEHEVFHSWFGRGVKPATARDGWIDEAFTSWATASQRREGPRFSQEPLELDAPPVLLYPPHPWSRYTPIQSYSAGAALFGGLAALLGDAGRLRSAMAGWYAANAGGLITTAGLATHLTSWSGVDVAPWFERFVYGGAPGDEQPAPAPRP